MIPTKPVRVFATVAAVCLCMIVGLTAYAEKDKEKDKKIACGASAPQGAAESSDDWHGSER